MEAKRGVSMFSKRLRILRENIDINQEKLGKILGLSTSTIGMYEQGRRQPDNETLLKLSDFFDVSVDYLLGKTEIKNYNKPYDSELEKLLFNQTKKLNSNEKEAVLNIVQLLGDK